jgi:ATP-binding cassette subfamily B protein
MSTHVLAVWSLIRDQRKPFGAAILALVLASCFLYLVPLIPQAVMDGVLVQPGTGKAPSAVVQFVVSMMGGRAFVASHLWVPLLVLSGFAACAAFFTYLRGRWAAQASEAVVLRVRDELYDHIQHLPSSYHATSETGDLIQRCTSDVETIRVFLSTQITEIGRAGMMLLVPLPLMFAMSPAMTLASVCLIPLIAGFSFIFFRNIRVAFKDKDESEGRLTARLQENLSGVRVVRAFAQQDHECSIFEEHNREFRDYDYHLYAIMAKFWALSDLLCFAQFSAVMATGLVLLVKGSLGVGTFYFFLAATNLFLWPMRIMGRILADLGKALVALERITEVLDVTPEAKELSTQTATEQDEQRAALVCSDVTFAYKEDAEPVLNGVSFSLPVGETLALVGPSGSGKSTLLELLMRLHLPQDGSIRVGGSDIREMLPKDVRSRMASVMQHPFLYSKTIAENIGMAREGATQDEIEEVARLASVHDSIEAFEDGYETRAGERGVTLSGGQRQRIALARALLRHADVLLLDDAMSAVDTETEQHIVEALKARKQTTVMVAHRLSTVMHADRILVMQGGRVVQEGSHRDLLAQDGWYAQLWEAQQAVVEPESMTETREAA